MAKRKEIGKKQRFEIFKRDGFTCRYCGSQPPDVVLQIDHIVPVADGGGNDDVNLVTSCSDCNSGKSDRSLDNLPPSMTPEDIETAKERMEQLREFNEYLLEERESQSELIQDIGYYWWNQIIPLKDYWTFAGSRVSSIRTFLKSLPAAEIYDAIDIAVSRKPPGHFNGQDDLTDSSNLPYDDKTWKYFCGICWNKIRDREAE